MPKTGTKNIFHNQEIYQERFKCKIFTAHLYRRQMDRWGRFGS